MLFYDIDAMPDAAIAYAMLLPALLLPGALLHAASPCSRC